MLTFDKNGFLMPYDSISSDFETLEAAFLFNQQREELYLELLSLLKILKEKNIYFEKIWFSTISRKS